MRFHKKHRPAHYVKLHPEADPVLKGIFAKIGKPEEKPFISDPFQLEALEAIKKTDCLVIAPTGAGKTWIAEQAIRSVFNAGRRCWYASPLKALTNAKWVEFGNHFESKNVGILTGDTKENADAPIIVGTTEILRNQLYDAMHRGENLNCDLVILDEAHYLGDYDRGVVWEETMIYLPARVNLLLLSATIGNGEEIARWLASIRLKPCVVVREEKRPVPLYPLFFHPAGKVMPLLEKTNIYSKVKTFMEEEAGSRFLRGRSYRFGNILSVLERFQLLPAIFFLKSRAECDAALKTCDAGRHDPEDDSFSYTLEELLGRFPFLENHKQLKYLKSSRVAAHHGGQLPAWKFFVETMMKRGHLKAIFATSTVAAGVNFPARTIVLFNSDIFNGHEFNPLTGIAFHQMTGRAGRRGQDKIGFMLVVPGRFMDIRHMKRLLSRKPEEILSQLRSDFPMVLNLLLSQTPEDIKDIFEMSLAAFQHHQDKMRIPSQEQKTLWEDFCRHLDFLAEEGFVNENHRLTENGIWASKLRLDQPMLIAECLKQEAFPKSDEKLLAAVVAPFIYDGDQDIKITYKKTPGKLSQATGKVLHTIKPLMQRMKEAGFEVNPLHLWTAEVMYDWAKGADWDELIGHVGIADGDLAMLVLRTADNLRQIMSLKETHPNMAELALKARKMILREPVVFE
jgi:superfamily II RNA helicase